MDIFGKLVRTNGSISKLLENSSNLHDPPLPSDLMLPYFDIDLRISEPLNIKLLSIFLHEFLVVYLIGLANGESLLGEVQLLICIDINHLQLLFCCLFVHDVYKVYHRFSNLLLY
jgi:hypothetical protein